MSCAALPGNELSLFDTLSFPLEILHSPSYILENSHFLALAHLTAQLKLLMPRRIGPSTHRGNAHIKEIGLTPGNGLDAAPQGTL
jgi:hypothetical protein